MRQFSRLLRTRGERPRRRATEERDELSPLQSSKLHLLPPKPMSEHNRLVSSKVPPQCDISIRLKSARGQNENPPFSALCQLRPAADIAPCARNLRSLSNAATLAPSKGRPSADASPESTTTCRPARQECRPRPARCNGPHGRCATRPVELRDDGGYARFASPHRILLCRFQ
jgi:hypothetical protein